MILEKVRLALRITTNVFDDEIQDLIEEAFSDLGLVGISTTDEGDPLIQAAVKTYCKLHFGSLAPTEYDRLKASYDEQKAQLRSASTYTRAASPLASGGACIG